MNLLGLFWVAHLSVALGGVPYETPPSDSTSPQAVEPAPIAPLHGLGAPTRWDLQAAVDWQRWKNMAAVTVVATTAAEDITPPSDSLPQPLQATCPAAHPHHPGAQALDLATVPAHPPSQPQTRQDSSGEGRFVIRVKGVAIGQVAVAAEAEDLAADLRQAMPALAQRPQDLSPKMAGEIGIAQIQGQSVFSLPPTAIQGDTSVALATAQWVNNLRLALGAPPLNPGQVQRATYGLASTSTRFQGTASWYGPYFHGRQTATGEIFDQEALTAAHKTLPFDTYLEVRNLLNGRTVVVRVNDRGPYVGDRSLDLSYAAARCLGSVQVGVIPYEATILTPGPSQTWEEAALPL